MASKKKNALGPLEIELHEVADSYTKLAPRARIAKVRELLSRGADPNARGDYGLTPLHRAVSSSTPPPSVEVVQALLDAGAKVDTMSDVQVTPLVAAVEGNDDAGRARIARSLELIELLVARGAALPPRTPLADFACASPEIFARLWELGADPSVADEHGRSAVHAVIETQRPRLLELLLAANVGLGTTDHLGRTPLGSARTIAAEYGRDPKTSKAIIARLVSAGAPEKPRAEDAPPAFPHDDVRRALREHPERDDVSNALTSVLAMQPPTFAAFVKALKETVGPPEDLVFALPTVIGALGKATKGKHTGELKTKTPFFHHGDYRVSGSLQIVGPFLVTGDLVVDGVVADAGPDSLVVVGGDVKAHSVITDGPFWVLGDIDARDVVYGHYNDHTLYASTIYAKLAIADEHDVQADVEAELHFDSDTFAQGYGKNIVKRLREVLVDDVFEGDEFDSGKLFARLHAAERVFRPAKKGAAKKGAAKKGVSKKSVSKKRAR